MKRHLVALALLSTTLSIPALALNIVITNDDGFEASTVHALRQRLIAAGHSVIICASTQDQSGRGGGFDFLKPVGPLIKDTRGGFVKAGSPGIGHLPDDPDTYYIDGAPAASALYCIDIATFKKWNQLPDLVISGPNYGNNTGLANNASGTFNAGLIAVNRGLPAIMVSAYVNDPLNAYKTYDKLSTNDPEYEYAEVVVKLVDELAQHRSKKGGALLPKGVGLNVNIPKFTAGQASRLAFKMTQVGTTAVGTPYFAEDLSTDAMAASYGMANIHLPGIGVALPGKPLPGKLSSVTDNDPNSEQNALNAGYVSISVVKGNHQASGLAEATVRRELRGIAQ